MLTSPSQLQMGAIEKMCISFHGFDDDDTEEFQLQVSIHDGNSGDIRHANKHYMFRGQYID